MALQFRNGEELADALGYGQLYDKSEQMQEKGLEMQESIKRMMKRLDNVKRTWTDYID